MPLFVELARGEAVEEAVARSDYDEVWNVLNRLQEHDDLLAQTISEMRAERGRTGGFDDTRFRERVEVLGPSVSLESLRLAITSACLDAIGDSWFERYGQLEVYKAEHGNCDVPARYPQNKRVGTWVVNQRVLRNDGQLAEDKIGLLDRLGFTWNPKARSWRDHYLALLAYRDRFGDCQVPRDWAENRKLSKWVATQRVRRRRGQVSAERIAMLDRVGFMWDLPLMTWHDRLEELRRYKEALGNTRVPARWKENLTLGQWVASQRYERRQKRLAAEQIRLLDELDFEWEVGVSSKHHTDDERIEALRKFQAENGHFAIPRSDKSLGFLASWATLVRRLRKQGTLSPELERRLDELGFAWKPVPVPNANHWDRKFAHLREWADKLGGLSDVPVNEATRTLRGWMTDLRATRKRGKLSEEQITSLDALDFKWVPREVSGAARRPSRPRETREPSRSWDEMLRVLADYFRIHGHCNVPLEWPADQELAWWVGEQRSARRRDLLAPAQLRALDEMGFAWSAHEADWDEMLAQLLAHRRAQQRSGRKRNRLPVEVQRWIVTQRQFRRRGRLSLERIKRLDAIGFEWAPFANQWEARFSELEAYRALRGHCRVPMAWPENPKLGHWVGVQRRNHKTGEITADHVARLESIGFEWSVRSLIDRSSTQSRAEMLAEIGEFHREHGHTRVPQNYAANKKLAWWVTTQRRSRRKGKLTEAQIAELDALSFVWQPIGLLTARANVGLSNVQYWEKMFAALEEYRCIHGNCLVPQKWPENRPLGGWIGDQRLARKLGLLDAERERRLEEIGFDWEPVTNRWEEMFGELLEFRRAHGNTNVPQRRAEYGELATWVRNQRRNWKIKRPVMTAERKARLDEIGFSWALKEQSAWELFFDQLLAFKKANGHCNVPQKWLENRALGKWVNSQRTFFKRGTLKSDRRQKLDEIGFVWIGKPSRQTK